VRYGLTVDYPAIEHRSTRSGRWLRERRLRLAFWTAVVEGLLVVFGVVSAWVALLVAAIVIAFYVLVGRSFRRDSLRQAAWVAAMSQVLVALVPVAAFVLTTLAIVVLAVLALLALALLLGDRR
jgi:hypothetical protein